MTTLFAYKAADDKWIDGFPTRKAAIESARATGLSTVHTVQTSAASPSYFARFLAQAMVQSMVDGLLRGVESQNALNISDAVSVLRPIAFASPADNFPGEGSAGWHLQIDLSNRLERAAQDWLDANGIRFDAPRFTDYGTEEVHIPGTSLNVPIL